MVNNLGGLFIPAHINREAYGLLPRLGGVPTDMDVEILEISRHADKATLISRFPELANYHLIRNGDVHYLDDFLGASVFPAEDSTLSAIRQGLISIS